MSQSPISAAQSRYCLDPAALRPGNGVRIFHSGDEAYECMLATIRGAQREVHLETYILAADRTGLQFRDALAERARAGVAVRVMRDGFGSAELPGEYVQYLRAAGAKVLEFRPFSLWRLRWSWKRRDHRKILVVDRRQGFTGGVNIADEYRTAASGGGDWQDVHLQVVGPAAEDLNALFLDTWKREGGEPIPDALPSSPPLDEACARLVAELGSEVAVQVLGNHRWRLRSSIRKAYLHAIRAAEKRIVLANAYFLPDLLFRRVLAAAARRGVEVRILVASKTDAMPIYYAQRRTFQRFFDAGVHIHEMRAQILHAKCAVVDGTWAIVGSYNLDHRSLFHNLEVTVNFVDPAVCARLEEILAGKQELCTAIDPAAWPARPWTQRLLETFWYWWRELL